MQKAPGCEPRGLFVYRMVCVLAVMAPSRAGSLPPWIGVNADIVGASLLAKAVSQTSKNLR
ncbi:hypothetical protein C4E44_24075 [Pseudomonas sp. MWU12-2312b]|nr:hypothetical protein C4E44_24075 [Pseudomonas sp. MWU12-2312b]